MVDREHLAGELAANPEAFVTAFSAEPAALAPVLSAEVFAIGQALAADPAFSGEGHDDAQSLRESLAAEPVEMAQTLVGEPAVLTRLLGVESATIAKAAAHAVDVQGPALASDAAETPATPSASAAQLVAALEAARKHNS